MVAWTVAGSLDLLLDQLDEAAPRRSRASDGAIGDPNHLARGWRSSDHNPHVVIAGRHYVTARDFTHDPRGGLDCARLAEALQQGLDRRLKYVIFGRRIMAGFGGPQPWQWRPYAGKNPHTAHLHLSVVPDARSLTRIPWLLPGLPSATGAPRPVLRIGASGPAVELLHRFLGVRRPGDPGYGVFDEATAAAVRRYQARRGVDVDGVVGPKTWLETGL